jgi:hypothetical protein
MRLTTIQNLVLGTLLMLGAYFDACAVTTMGAKPCGEWVKNEESNDWPAIVQHGWVIGFISGVSVAVDSDVLKTASKDSIYLWITNYCRRNPLENSGDAAAKLSVELLQKKN